MEEIINPDLRLRRRRGHPNDEEDTQTHVHEFLGSTKLAEEEEDRHNHRFASVTTEEIPKDCSHVHGFSVNTDFFDHHHEIAGQTDIAVKVGDDKHVHFAKDMTTEDDGHVHEFQFATLIESPLLPQKQWR
jgi:hypothetical protein